MSKHYIKPGVCGICGRAVVRFNEPERGWINGHLYSVNSKKELVLEMVRCMNCKENGDPREYDEDGKLHQTRILKNPFYD